MRSRSLCRWATTPVVLGALTTPAPAQEPPCEVQLRSDPAGDQVAAPVWADGDIRGVSVLDRSRPAVRITLTELDRERLTRLGGLDYTVALTLDTRDPQFYGTPSVRAKIGFGDFFEWGGSQAGIGAAHWTGFGPTTGRVENDSVVVDLPSLGDRWAPGRRVSLHGWSSVRRQYPATSAYTAAEVVDATSGSSPTYTIGSCRPPEG